MDSGKRTFKQAFMSTPGPTALGEALGLWLKGFCMGGADIIPGVSGGTVAFITGIYDMLVDAIRSFDLRAAKYLFTLNMTGLAGTVHFRFLACLLLGILTAVVSMAQVMNHLLIYNPVETWSLFFGLIAASVYVVGRHIKPLNGISLLLIVLGTAASYSLVGMIPVSTPETLPFVFFCGAIAICAMILPGISGAFILLMLGKYEYITRTLKNPFDLGNLIIILAFVAGAGVGIVVFSRLLHYLLHRWHGATMSVLTGFMLGALRKVWPWKEVLDSVVIRGRVHVLQEQNVLPQSLDGEVWVALTLAVVGVLVVMVLEFLSGRERS